MSAFRKIRDELAAIFREPEPLTPEQIRARADAAFEAEQAAERARAAQKRIEYAQKLAKFKGRLFLTTDFGPFEGDWTQHTTRTVDALGAAGLGPSAAVGASIHLNSTRGVDGQTWQYGTRAAITGELQQRGYGTVLPPVTVRHDLRYSLLRMLTRAAEDTAMRAQAQNKPSDFGHIAVVAAYEMPEIDVPRIPENGTLFVLQGVDTERGRLSWQQLAADPQALR